MATIRFVTSGCPSVRLPARNNTTFTGRIFIKFDIIIFFEKMCYLVRFFPTKVVQKTKTHILYSITTVSKIEPLIKIMWENIVGPGRSQMTKWLMRFACWIPKDRNTLEICNTYCVCTATIVAQMRPKCYVIRALSLRFMFHVTNVCNKTEIKKLSAWRQLSSFIVLFIVHGLMMVYWRAKCVGLHVDRVYTT
jgi:hypothetical protein